MSTPVDIRSFLTPDEELLRAQRVSEGELYITNRRVILKRGSSLKDIIGVPYRSISSIEPRTTRSWGPILRKVGIFFIVFVVFSRNLVGIEMPDELFYFGIIAGFVGITVSFFHVPSYLIHVEDQDPLKLSAKNIEDMITIIRKYWIQ